MRRRFDRNIALAESILVRVLALTVAFAYDLYVVLELQNQYFFRKNSIQAIFRDIYGCSRRIYYPKCYYKHSEMLTTPS
jgi:hypothetical protein